MWAFAPAENLIFKNFTPDHGLPSSEVYHLYQDPNGFMWFATDRGISRFDGYSFQNFGLEDGLTDMVVFRFYPQKDGNVYCATRNNRVFYFHPDSLNFRPYIYNDRLEKHAERSLMRQIYLDEEKTLHIAFANGPLSLISINLDGSIRNSVYRDSKSTLLKFEFLADGTSFTRSIQPDDQFLQVLKNGKSFEVNLGLVSATNYYAFVSEKVQVWVNLETLYIVAGNRPPRKISSKTNIIETGFYDDSHFYVAYSLHGAMIYDLEGELVDSILSDYSVSHLIRDRNNGLWCSTLNSGVFYCAQPEARVMQEPGNHKITSICIARKNEVWLGHESGLVSKRIGNELRPILNHELKTTSMVGWYPDSRRMVFKIDNLITLQSENGKTEQHLFGPVNAISDSDLDGIWVSSIRHFLKIGNNSVDTFSTKHRIYDLCPINGGLYLGCHKGLYYYSDYKEMSGEPRKIFSMRVNDIDPGNDLLFAASLGAGVLVINKDSVYTIGKKEGMSSNVVNQIYVESDSLIWAATNAGLNRIILKRGQAPKIDYTTTGSLLNHNEVMDVAISMDTVWVATREGLCYFPKSVMNNDLSLQNPLYLEISEIRVNNQIQIKDELLSLAHDQNRLEISYRAISFRENNALNYRFRMEGHENQWNFSKQLRIKYNSIPAGSFTFVLQARLGQGNWSPEIRLPMVIALPFYQRIWFYFLVIVLLGLMVYWFFKIKILTYNRDITRELLRHTLRKVSPKNMHFVIREDGKDIKIKSKDVIFVKSAGNYLEVHTVHKKHVIRSTMKAFSNMVPDKLEYLQINRSYIIRLDKVTEKDSRMVVIGGEKIPIGKTFREATKLIHLDN